MATLSTEQMEKARNVKAANHLAAIADAREAGREFSNLRLRRLWD